jgi:uncharacterized membrane protein
VNSHVIEVFRLIFEWSALGIELLAVTVIVARVVILGVQRGTVRQLFELDEGDAFERCKRRLGKALLLALDLLVAADVIRTVALEATMRNVSVLGLLVVVRTFLSWSLSLEVEGRWPWQARAPSEIDAALSNKHRD